MDCNTNFKIGSIRKIEVTNFVTYSYAEVNPGPYLNMLIGPNGTGKSTMVAAIILGLGGTPKIVGRGTKVSDYVKYNCTEATINIYLQGVDNEIEKVTREINVQNQTCYKINDRRVTGEQLAQFTQQYQIQINNLCQFLPQDRVQEFAKLNKQELLRETQLALCRTDLLEKQQNLIDLKGRDGQLKKKIETYTTELQEAQVVVANLEAKVANLNKKKEYSRKLEAVERKMAWLNYEQVREQLSDVKKDQTNAQNICNKQRKLFEPVESEIAETKKQIKSIDEQNNKLLGLQSNIQAEIQSDKAKLAKTETKIQQISDEKQRKIDDYNRIKIEKDSLLKKLKDFEEVKRAKEEQARNKSNAKALQEFQKLNNEIGEINRKRDEIVIERERNVNTIQLVEREIKNIESVKERRLNALRNSKPDVYRAVMWLRENRHLFHGHVYEPIMIELNILDGKNGRFFENVIPMRDRLAFICTSVEDMNLMMRQLKLKLGLSVNILHSDEEDLSGFQPSIPIEQLRPFGFYSYLNSLATAPPAVMHYLCKYYRLHNIPIGTESVLNNYTKVPSSIKLFFSEQFRFAVKASKYSNSSSIRQNGIRSDGTLSLSQDTLRLETMRGKCKEIQKCITVLNEQIKKVDDKISALKKAGEQIRRDVDEIKRLQNESEAAENKILYLKSRINQMKIPSDWKVFEEEAEQKIEQVRKSQESIENQIESNKNKLEVLAPKISDNADKIDELRTKIMSLESEIEENRSKLKDDEKTLEKIKEAYRRTLAMAKELLNKAKSLSKGFMPNEDGFDEFRKEYDELSANLEQLNNEKEKIISLIDCLNTANSDEVNEYEAKLKLIEELEEKLEKANKSLENLDTDVNSLKKQWLDPLKELIEKINEKFSASFAKIDCAGEVSLDTGEDEMDFSKYGINIKVSYRSGMALQQLNRTVQSGGERAVATAAFMLSLQEFTPVPFRCVDEINQGMDINNERRIFELLVEATSKSNTSQYFLITPKLATKLTYPPTALIHIVHNGPFVKENDLWTVSEACNFFPM